MGKVLQVLTLDVADDVVDDFVCESVGFSLWIELLGYVRDFDELHQPWEHVGSEFLFHKFIQLVLLHLFVLR